MLSAHADAGLTQTASVDACFTQSARADAGCAQSTRADAGFTQSARADAGFTLIELVITLAVLATLTVLGMPSFAGAISNAKVRTAAEALQNGLRNAQGEAIRRSHQTAFVLTNSGPVSATTANMVPATNGKYWYIQVLPVVSGETLALADAFVQGGEFGDQTAGVTIAGPAVICFNSIGRVVGNGSVSLGGSAVSCTAPNPSLSFDVTRSDAARTLELQVSAAGKIRMCDKARSIAAAPDGC